jgi:alpha-ketoglutarate-dependent taurine dioxygenase
VSIMARDLSLKIDRLEAARSRLTGPVHLTEPFTGSPPLWIEPASELLTNDTGAFVQWMADNHEAIEAALLSFGAIVWRGFPVSDTGDFISMMDRFEGYSKGYAGGTSNRKAIKGAAMEATRTPPHVYIQLHQEMSYMPDSPRALAFFCKQAPESGGETVICDMRGLLEEIPADTRSKFADLGARYVRNLRSAEVDDWRADPELRHATWQYWFDSEDRDEIAAKLDERGTHYRWNDDGSLTFWNCEPAVANHPLTGEALYFNQLNSQIQNAYTIGPDRAGLFDRLYADHTDRPYSVSFGNGEPVTEDDYLALRAIFEARKIAFAWRAGDVMLLDNKLTAHGRHPYTGERDVQVMLFE